MTCSIIKADALLFLRAQPEGSLDLVFGSPPYEQARLYLENGEDLGVARNTAEWVEWMADVHEAAQTACRGLVAFVVAGQTRNYRWSAGPALLIAELHRRGLSLRNPPIFSRVGIPGSGRQDWLRGDYEWIVCTTRPGKLPWSDNTACGHPPKWAPGGEMSHRLSDGSRTNQWGKCGTEAGANGSAQRTRDGGRQKANRPSHKMRTKSGVRHKTFHQPNGEKEDQQYEPPAIANPGNLIEQAYTAAEVEAFLAEASDVRRHIVGGGVMGGDVFTRQNEAPFPEALAEFFVLSFCPPSGTVCDPFSGSGTTAAVAVRHGRNFTGCDLRESQVDLGLRRVAQETPPLFT